MGVTLLSPPCLLANRLSRAVADVSHSTGIFGNLQRPLLPTPTSHFHRAWEGLTPFTAHYHRNSGVGTAGGLYSFRHEVAPGVPRAGVWAGPVNVTKRRPRVVIRWSREKRQSRCGVPEVHMPIIPMYRITGKSFIVLSVCG